MVAEDWKDACWALRARTEKHVALAEPEVKRGAFEAPLV
jgi:hypothetical protein